MKFVLTLGQNEVRPLKDGQVSDKMVTVKRNAIVCPRCRQRIAVVRVTETTVFRDLDIKCPRCGLTFLADYQPGPAPERGQRH